MIEQTSLGPIECYPLWVCGRKTHFHIVCCMSPDYSSGPVRGTICWLFPWCYTRQDWNIRGGHQFYWCVSLLRYNGHVYIFHREHLLYLIGNLHL